MADPPAPGQPPVKYGTIKLLFKDRCWERVGRAGREQGHREGRALVPQCAAVFVPPRFTGGHAHLHTYRPGAAKVTLARQSFVAREVPL